MKEGLQSDSSSTSELFRQAQSWLQEDWCRVEKSLAGREVEFRGKTILVTGAAGFLGFHSLIFFVSERISLN